MIRCPAAEMAATRADVWERAVSSESEHGTDSPKFKAASDTALALDDALVASHPVSVEGRRAQASIALDMRGLDKLDASPSADVIRARVAETDHPDTRLLVLIGRALAAQGLGSIGARDALLVEAQDVRAVTVDGMAARVGIAEVVIDGMTRLPEAVISPSAFDLSAALASADGLPGLVRDVLPAVDRLSGEIQASLIGDTDECVRSDTLQVLQVLAALHADVRWLLGLDPTAWVELAMEAGHRPMVVVQADGSAGLFTHQVDLCFRVPPVAEEHLPGLLAVLRDLGRVVDGREASS